MINKTNTSGIVFLTVLTSTAILFGQLSAAASNPPQRGISVDFYTDIKPILKAHCMDCHGEKKPRGGLQFTTRKNALLETDSGKRAVVPGKAHASELVRRVVAKDQRHRMPPKGTKLSQRHVRLLKNWIDQGAVWPDAEKTHWAYVKPVRPVSPRVNHRGWVKNSIDNFVLARLEEEGLKPSPPAMKARLLRRVSIDLIGLPPTIEQLEAFLADNRPDAYERVVDELLRSPHYGERWARHWLDLARYADSNGFQRDGFREVWPYRDWVVNAMNKDMPFDQFTIEQIAGDLLPNAALSQKVATAFNRCTTVNVEAGVDREEDRVNAVFDRVSTTATVWLGTSMVCGQCHDHKYDPFTQKDYYQLFAYFNTSLIETKAGNSGANREFTGPKVTLPMDPKLASERDQLQRRKTMMDKHVKQLVRQASKDQKKWELQTSKEKRELVKLPKNIRKIVQIAAKKRNKKQKQQLSAYFTNRNPVIKKGRAELAALTARLNKLQAATCLVMEEMKSPRPTHIFKRGNFLDKLAQVRPGTPSGLHPLPNNAPANRLGLARWLVDKENPLVARVTVNRWWAEFFGHGIVSTLEDFGTQCEPPTHPELLDWLATELMQQGWSMKNIHRLIVTSAAYRQSSNVTKELLAKDPKNRLYARGPRLRMSAEMIRDNALRVSGLLSPKMGGPPVFPPQPKGIWNVIGRVDNTYRTSTGEDRYRRGLYTIWRRSSPYPSFVAFDAPNRSACVVKRPRTNTPLQALTLMNDPVYVEAALALGRRMQDDRPEYDLQQKLKYGFRLALSRNPNKREADVLERLYKRALDRYQSAPEDAHKLLGLFPDYKTEASVELATWFQVATVLLNLDETITKN